MRLTEYIDYLNNGAKNEKKYTHFSVNPEKSIVDNKLNRENTAEEKGK
jgi:hypothetical protein